MAELGFGDRLRKWFGLPPRQRAEGNPGTPQPVSDPVPPNETDREISPDERLPESSLHRVREIRALIGELDGRVRECGLFEEGLELERLKQDHLPRLIRSYVDIPQEHRAEVFRETGRSASYLLNERLEKILERLKAMSRQLARGNIDAFAENMRFVDTRYGAKSPFD